MKSSKIKDSKVPSQNREMTADYIRDQFLLHIKNTCYKDWRSSTDFDKLMSLSHVTRDLVAERMIATQGAYLDKNIKRLYYLSLEFLIGQLLRYNLNALGIFEETKKAMASLKLDLDELCEMEPDAGLGNGGLGRLAACFLESMASMELPGYGYGLRYEHGMFKQEFEDGWQKERPDDWLKYGTPWEVVRPEYTVPIFLYGHLEKIKLPNGKTKDVWLDWQMIEGVPYDIAVVGTDNRTANILRLWASRASEGFRIDVFNRGEYVKSVENENWAETVTKVLYPSDSIYAGKELRLIQEYFMVSCAINDIIRRYLKNHKDMLEFHKYNAIQLNDTHPALAVAELMNYMVSEADLPWDKAWDVVVKTFGYTNHTLLPEALERWPVELMQRVLPRHMQTIFDINFNFLQKVELRFPGNTEKQRSMSIIEEGDRKQVRMANLAIVGSHSVNGVSALHSELIKKRLIPDFVEMEPLKFNNKTNGINHRRWLMQCNPELTDSISKRIGTNWKKDLYQLRKIEEFLDDVKFCAEFAAIKRRNKEKLAKVVYQTTGEKISPDSLFDVQVKRLHEYKRQLLNAMHIITLFNRIRENPSVEIVPRTFIFGAKAAPSYHIAKRIIKLINTMAESINSDPDVNGRLKIIFLPDYRVSLAEKIMPAADLSEQISTAGTEASGTGNMKLTLNGALTIGTWDGANIEIAEEVGLENIFIFGHRAEALSEMRRNGYNPNEWVSRDPELSQVIETMRINRFDRQNPDLFHDLLDNLFNSGDHYFHFADYRMYIDAQQKVSNLYMDKKEWIRKSILNVARSGKFSSDRTIREYAEDIWDLKRVPIN
jgi:starch phosphorylase